ncbi:proprotein convertase P-domain-containing protein [uncultured Erythrobacter sp.]|uniref:proprotein convertase P-domain-containing protein n=1 Tax=uncultured Erythrobacter sp. TaxID=263913 RepID=UPI00262604E3|nr:proprotein convertase P-domain-containing protein [uncultured Erythrobacter sp.]
MNKYASQMSLTRLQIRIERTLLIAIQAAIALLCLAFAQPAMAQTTNTYVVTNDGTISGSTPCGTPLVRNFVVGDSFTVADVDLGFFATHTWRGDIRVTLQAPDGTRVQLVNGETNNTNGDNINVLLDDDFATVVNSTNITVAHSTVAPPPFENNRAPNNALSAFNGVSSAGTWRLEICDLFTGADDGIFRHAELYLTSAVPANFADLSLTKALVGSPPVQGGSVTWRLTVTNNSASPDTATGVVVNDNLPTGFTFLSASGDGSFNQASGDWTVGSLAPGESKTITLQGSISSAAGTTITNTAEVVASSEVDSDSTVNNGATGEDDFASSSFTVQSGRSPGVPPILSCPAGQSVFDWDTIPGWTTGSTNNTYAFASFGNIQFQLSNDGAFLNSANFGGQTPTVFNYYTGGISPAEDSLHMLADQANQSGDVTIVITLPRSFTGLQFSIFDVDFGANQFADRVQVTGTNSGASVTPTLTNGNVNFVSGNVVIGDGASTETQPLGNVVVTFTQAVDTITISYGNHTTAPTDPGQQGISIHDINVCNPFTTLNVSKVSSLISDPVNGSTNPKAIPGATVEYLITVTNTGGEPADADSVVVWDDGPADAKMCLITRAAGPVIFADPGSNSGLTYGFTSLAATTDDVEFSNDDGVNFNYTPTADGDGCDSAITDFRVLPGGAFGAGGNFTVTVRYIIE